jgi:hypothetical protein
MYVYDDVTLHRGSIQRLRRQVKFYMPDVIYVIYGSRIGLLATVTAFQAVFLLVLHSRVDAEQNASILLGMADRENCRGRQGVS